MAIVMLIFIIALFFGAVGTPLVRRMATRTGFIAVPQADRAHTEPTALMGGLAIYIAAIIALILILFATALVGNALRLSEVISIIIAGSLMAAIGLWDDKSSLPAYIKLAIQFVPILIVYFAGVQANPPLSIFGIDHGLLNFFVTAGWILYITNAINYLDNADGIAVMTSATTSAIFLLIAILNDQQLVSLLAAAVLGASLGFARYNLPLPKSTIFMGDSGSLFLGFLLAVLGIKIRIPANEPEITWMVPIIVLGLPIFDTILVFISRTRRRVSFFRGGVDHTTHRLARLGMDRLSVALVVGLICGVLGLIAIFVTQASRSEAYLVFASLGVIFLYVLWQIELKPSYKFRTGLDELPTEIQEVQN